jgi:hypothetical protein
MTILINTTPFTRVNDRFITNRNLINKSTVDFDVTHELIQGEAMETNFYANFYKKIALDIVTETVLDYPYVYITEKTFRPIIQKRMFIILGPCGIISFLNKQGFETFNDIIDENYDSIRDPEYRLLAVAGEVKKFCSLPLEEIKEYYYKNQNKFENNFQLLEKYKEKELERIQNLIDGQKN